LNPEVLTRGRKRSFIAAAAIVAVAMIAVYMCVDPSSGYYPRCAFKALTGLSCPGCGSQRALHALLNGDLRGALAFNALFVAEIPLLVMIGLPGLYRTRFSRLRRVVTGQTFILSVLAVIVIWTVARNIFGF